MIRQPRNYQKYLSVEYALRHPGRPEKKEFNDELLAAVAFIMRQIDRGREQANHRPTDAAGGIRPATIRPVSGQCGGGRVSGGLGDKPELKWIKLTELYIPSEYQRTVKGDSSQKNIRYIRDNFNWASCGAILVCELEKSKPTQFAVIDGQHRFRAAEANGQITELPCVVISPRDAKKQAGHFIEVNSKRIKLNNLAQYHAAVVAGDANATSLDDILRKAKISVPASPMGNNDCPPRTTQAIGTLLRMIDRYSEKQIIWALTIIPEALWRKTRHDARQPIEGHG